MHCYHHHLLYSIVRRELIQVVLLCRSMVEAATIHHVSSLWYLLFRFNKFKLYKLLKLGNNYYCVNERQLPL